MPGVHGSRHNERAENDPTLGILVYLVANMTDLAFIFPILVAKLVNLHPIILIVAVIIGQNYYGLVGMLISIPIAAVIKIIVQEIYSAVYHPIQSTPRPF